MNEFLYGWVRDILVNVEVPDKHDLVDVVLWLLSSKAILCNHFSSLNKLAHTRIIYGLKCLEVRLSSPGLGVNIIDLQSLIFRELNLGHETSSLAVSIS